MTADIVVLRMPLYKNPFLWLGGASGLTLTAAIASDEGTLSAPVLVSAGITAALVFFAVLLYRAKLTIGPVGFREQMPFWLDVEYTWADVSAFYIRTDEEALDAIAYVVDGGQQIVAGAYPGSLLGLCERLNVARERALTREVRT